MKTQRWSLIKPWTWPIWHGQAETGPSVVRPFATNSIRPALRQARLEERERLERQRTKRTGPTSESNGAKNPIPYNRNDIQISRGVISLSRELKAKIVRNLQSKLKLAQINISDPGMFKQLHSDSTLAASDRESISSEIGSEVEVEVDRSNESSAVLFISLKEGDTASESVPPPGTGTGTKLRYVK